MTYRPAEGDPDPKEEITSRYVLLGLGLACPVLALAVFLAAARAGTRSEREDDRA
ncbi:MULTISPECIES: hypothetical protein [Kitasatospora]|uniref:Uncharacterized protein n=1 Tax=Kitasatospora arboriphila TaxID=258052 RepID=A0ABN1TGN7_9ACTN